MGWCDVKGVKGLDRFGNRLNILCEFYDFRTLTLLSFLLFHLMYMLDYPLFTFLNFFFFSFHIFNVLSFKDNNCWWGQNNRPRQTEGCAMHWYLTLKAGQTQFDGMLTFPVKTSLNNYKLWDGWAMVLILFIKQWVTKSTKI